MSTDPWGRVDDDGTVYVRTAEGERAVGSWQAGEPEEALAYFHRKFDELATQVELLEQRLRGTDLPPAQAEATIVKLRESIADAHAVGDLASLEGRLDALTEVVGKRREEVRAARDLARAQSREIKERIVAEAERIAEDTTHWKSGGERLRQLVEEWKTAERIDRVTEAALWKRLSAARTAFAKRRKSYFAGLDEQRESVRSIKERIVSEAEALATSTDWGPTASAYRDLMQRVEDRRPGLPRGRGRPVDPVQGRPGPVLPGPIRGVRRTRRLAPGQRRGQGAHPRRRGAHRPRDRRQGGAIRPTGRARALGGRRTGAARGEGQARRRPAQDRRGGSQGRGGRVEAVEPRGARTGRRPPSTSSAGRSSSWRPAGQGLGRRQGQGCEGGRGGHLPAAPGWRAERTLASSPDLAGDRRGREDAPGTERRRGPPLPGIAQPWPTPRVRSRRDQECRGGPACGPVRRSRRSCFARDPPGQLVTR